MDFDDVPFFANLASASIPEQETEEVTPNDAMLDVAVVKTEQEEKEERVVDASVFERSPPSCESCGAVLPPAVSLESSNDKASLSFASEAPSPAAPGAVVPKTAVLASPVQRAPVAFAHPFALQQAILTFEDVPVQDALPLAHDILRCVSTHPQWLAQLCDDSADLLNIAFAKLVESVQCSVPNSRQLIASLSRLLCMVVVSAPMPRSSGRLLRMREEIRVLAAMRPDHLSSKDAAGLTRAIQMVQQTVSVTVGEYGTMWSRVLLTDDE